MKKDIQVPDVKGVYIAAILEINQDLGEDWTVHVINDQEVSIEGVLITSRGYDIEGEEIVQRSTTLRHTLGEIAGKSLAKVEPIASEVFEIYNEYWLTFFQNGQLLERKFTFGPHTIDATFLESLPTTNLKGILIR